MNNSSKFAQALPPEQQAIRDKCFHPAGSFVEFPWAWTERSIPDIFEEQVRRFPERLAVKDHRQELTYQELNRWANRVARAILAQVGASDEPVALLLDQGPAMVAGMMGVWKAGKLFVALDPTFPTARCVYLLDDAQSKLLLTNHNNRELAEELAAQRTGPNAMGLANIEELDTALAEDDLKLAISPDRPANISYTSGSTGQPKGFVQTHLHRVHDVMVHTNILRICPHDRLTLLHSVGLIGSVKDTVNALLNGAALIPYDIKQQGLAHLPEWLAREGVTIYRSAATVFRHFVESLIEAGTETGAETGTETGAETNGEPGAETGDLRNLRAVLLGAEQIYRRDFELYRDNLPASCVFITGLALSETGRFACYYMDHHSQVDTSVVPSGYPVGGTRALLLNDAGQEVPPGEVGEIVVKSRYLSTGYWRQPERTAEDFLPDPQGGDETIYHTGDLGYRREDGCLIHAGRKDSQIKIRGFRVEIPEVELALLALESVKAVAVIPVDEGAGEQRLVAYCVPKADAVLAPGQLRQALLEKLPSYMVPSAFIEIASLPLMDNGKLNRRGLPDPKLNGPDSGTAYVAPRTPVEEELARIWSEILGLERVGIDDNFLELGGDSLRASRIMARSIRAFRVDVPLKVLMDSPTVAAMAMVIVEHQAQAAGPEAIESILAEIQGLTAGEARRAG